MKSEKLLDEIGLIDDEIVFEASDEAPYVKNTVKRKWVKWVIAAAAVSLAVGISILYRSSMSDTPATPNVPKIPIISDVGNSNGSIKYYSSNKLEKITCSFASEGMDGGGDFGFFIVKDYSEVATANPTRNNTASITELPIFKNEAGLWSEADHDISTLGKKVYFNHPAYEKTKDYNFFGISTNTWNVCFKHDDTENIVDQLLDYSFYRVFYAIYNIDGVETGWSKVMKPPAEAGILYPINSIEEATKKLRNGEFFCHGNERKVAKTAEILSVELVYLTDEYQKYLQPFYMFTITDKSWDLKGVMSCNNVNEFTSVSQVYVPAVVDKYLDITEPEVHFN